MRILRDARIGRIGTLVVMTAVVLGVALNSIGLLDPNVNREAKVQQATALLPTLFFIGAIWTIERAFKAIGKGEAIEAALSSLMERLGLCLFLGGLAFVFAQPLLLKLLTDWSAWAWFDVPSITLGCLGLLLFVMARPLRDAGNVRAELDEIL